MVDELIYQQCLAELIGLSCRLCHLKQFDMAEAISYTPPGILHAAYCIYGLTHQTVKRCLDKIRQHHELRLSKHGFLEEAENQLAVDIDTDGAGRYIVPTSPSNCRVA